MYYVDVEACVLALLRGKVGVCGYYVCVVVSADVGGYEGLFVCSWTFCGDSGWGVLMGLECWWYVPWFEWWWIFIVLACVER